MEIIKWNRRLSVLIYTIYYCNFRVNVGEVGPVRRKPRQDNKAWYVQSTVAINSPGRQKLLC